MKISKIQAGIIGALLLIVIISSIFLTSKTPSPTSFLPPDRSSEPLVMNQIPVPRAPAASVTPLAVAAPASTSGTLIPNAEITKSVLDRKVDADLRFENLTTLIARGPAALPAIAVIAAAPVPNFPRKGQAHSLDATRDRFEKSIRITAIEALDKLAAAGSADARPALENVRDSHQDTEIIFLANLALSGIAEGRPGKVTRFIDQVFNEKVQ